VVSVCVTQNHAKFFHGEAVCHLRACVVVLHFISCKILFSDNFYLELCCGKMHGCAIRSFTVIHYDTINARNN